MDDPTAMPAEAGPVGYACPMHPEVTGADPLLRHVRTR